MRLGSNVYSSHPEYVQRLVEVLGEVRRVLRNDGTLWLNLGDSFATGAGQVGECPGGGEQGERWKGYRGTRGESPKHSNGAVGPITQANRLPQPDLKPKDLMGIPWRVAFALQAEGWYLRSEIIWHKPNPMPESVLDRPTKSHEQIFLLAKSERYYYDTEAIKEPAIYAGPNGAEQSPYSQGFGRRTPEQEADRQRGKGGKNAFRGQGAKRARDNGPSNREGRDMQDVGAGLTRNNRSVWTVSTRPFPEAHFATFPPKLIEPCILAGCPEGGTVLDPFSGAGTTGMASLRLGRSYIGIELNPAYVEMSQRRIMADSPLFNTEVTAASVAGAELHRRGLA